MKYLLALLLLLPSCLTPVATEEALLPAARAAWPNVRMDYELGVNDGVADGDLTPEAADALMGLADELDAGLADGTRAALVLVPWSASMAQWVTRGIASEVDEGRLGPNGAQILYQRASNFTAVLLTLQGELVGAFTLPAVRQEREEDNPYIRTPEERRLYLALEETR